MNCRSTAKLKSLLNPAKARLTEESLTSLAPLCFGVVLILSRSVEKVLPVIMPSLRP